LSRCGVTYGSIDLGGGVMKEKASKKAEGGKMGAKNKFKVSISFLLLGLTVLWWLSAASSVSAQTYDFDEGLEAVTKGLVSENSGILKRKKIAVFGMIESKSGEKWEISSHIEDGIVDALVDNGYRVIERRRVQDVIKKEIKETTDLWFDQARVAQFGKLVGADFVVTGRYVLWGQGMLKISIRAINVADGEIVAAEKVKVHTDRIANLLKSEEKKKHVKVAKVSPEKPIRVKRIHELTHESGKLGNYKALIIGINDYEGPKIPDLETATNDATAMAKVLKERYGFEVKLLLDREATKDLIYRELRNLTVSTKENDSVLIYFAGHGDLDRTYDGGWWIPADATGGNPVTYLDNAQVQKAMRSMKARHVLLVSDSCYSGTLFGKARSLPPVIDDTYYLSLYNEKSRWGITSGNKTPVSDQGTGGHSAFAYQLIKELGESEKPFLSTRELYARIAPVIANNSEQTPVCRPIINTGDQGGEFVFVASVKKELPPAVPKVHQRTLNKDMLFWQSVRDSNDPALYRAYLKKFPDGIFALIAKRKIETLRKKRGTAAAAPAMLKSRLFVEVEPRDARVRILNIGPKFYQGMALDPGGYHMEVSRSDYKTEKMWAKLEQGKDTTLKFSLGRKSVPQTNASKVHKRTLDRDMLFWQSVRDSNDPALFRAYLKTFPDGIFAVIAKQKIETLKQKKGNASTPPAILKSRLFVEVEPRDARVRILNIGLKFHQGMALDPGRYHTEVSRKAYKTERIWAKLEPGKNATLMFSLEKKPVPQTDASIKQTPKHSTPVIPPYEEKISRQDGIYVAYTNGIVRNTNTGLEWKAGPDKNTSWEKARSWVRSLNLAGGGWRMPTKNEIKSLYKAGAGTCNMTPLFKTTAWWVWSRETKGSSNAWIFYFSGGYGYWLNRSTSDNLRAFAVRSRNDG